MLPGWLSDKESACNAGDIGSNAGSGWSSGEGNGNPLQYSCLGNPWTKETGRLQTMVWQKSQTWLASEHVLIFNKRKDEGKKYILDFVFLLKRLESLFGHVYVYMDHVCVLVESRTENFPSAQAGPLHSCIALTWDLSVFVFIIPVSGSVKPAVASKPW